MKSSWRLTAGAIAAIPIFTACGEALPLDQQITANLTGTGWSFVVPPAPDTRSSQWFGPGWAVRDVSNDGGATWCRAGYTWSIVNAVDLDTFTIAYVHSDDACGFVEGTDERFRFHMTPDPDNWATSGRFLPGEPADSTFGALVLSADLCASDANAYASDCGQPNGTPVAP